MSPTTALASKPPSCSSPSKAFAMNANCFRASVRASGGWWMAQPGRTREVSVLKNEAERGMSEYPIPRIPSQARNSLLSECSITPNRERTLKGPQCTRSSAVRILRYDLSAYCTLRYCDAFLSSVKVELFLASKCTFAWMWLSNVSPGRGKEVSGVPGKSSFSDVSGADPPHNNTTAASTASDSCRNIPTKKSSPLHTARARQKGSFWL
mmetsp:Transcript_18864/g.38378  ORF Transcript_18864/g.38378 Transcript_18864/m.38378 type:complete len:209 (+) Transcript_18864:549-1175(+)